MDGHVVTSGYPDFTLGASGEFFCTPNTEPQWSGTAECTPRTFLMPSIDTFRREVRLRNILHEAHVLVSILVAFEM